MSMRPTRRRFLQSASATAAAVAAYDAWAAEAVPKALPTPLANEKINVAFIGATGRGGDNLAAISKIDMANIVALCDVDEGHLDEASRKYPNAKRHTDFRKMLDTQKDIDAVVVSIPDNNHAVAAMHAMRLGKHVYCEKPLTHDIFEARTLRDAARQYKVATQMGNTGTASKGLRMQVDWLRAGVIGTIKEVHAWTDRPVGWWPQGLNRPSHSPPPPANLHWDNWIGPAPERPYDPAYHPFKWRGWWDFGTGALGDMACHIVNTAFWALELTGPCEVEAEQEGITSESGPLWSVITYRFPQRGSRPPVKLVWHDGGKKPEKPEGIDDDAWKKTKSGSIFIGEKGTLFGAMGMPTVVGPAAKDLVPPKPVLPISPGHYQEWLLACRGGTPAMANFDYAAPLTETVLLGNVALRLGKRIEWDSGAMKVKDTPQADALIRREYRKGWEL